METQIVYSGERERERVGACYTLFVRYRDPESRAEAQMEGQSWESYWFFLYSFITSLLKFRSEILPDGCDAPSMRKCKTDPLHSALYERYHRAHEEIQTLKSQLESRKGLPNSLTPIFSFIEIHMKLVEEVQGSSTTDFVDQIIALEESAKAEYDKKLRAIRGKYLSEQQIQQSVHEAELLGLRETIDNCKLELRRKDEDIEEYRKQIQLLKEVGETLYEER